MAYLDKNRTSQSPLAAPGATPGTPIPIAPGSAAPGRVGPTPEAPRTVAPGLTQAPGSNFPDLTAYLRANQDAAVGMGQQAAGGLGMQARAAIQSAQGDGRVGSGDYSGIPDIQSKIDSSGTDAGRQGLLADKFGAAPTPGGSRLDSYLVGQVGSSPLDALRAQYSGLLSSVSPQDLSVPRPPGPPIGARTPRESPQSDPGTGRAPLGAPRGTNPRETWVNGRRIYDKTPAPTLPA